MSEALLVDRLLARNISFVGIKKESLEWKKEVKSRWNRADIVCYQKKSDGNISKIIAIEAKLHDWRRALWQANRDRLFADRVFVALPEENAAPALAKIEEFQRASIGLVLVGEKKNKLIYDPPISGMNSPVHREHVISFLTKVPVTTDAIESPKHQDVLHREEKHYEQESFWPLLSRFVLGLLGRA